MPLALAAAVHAGVLLRPAPRPLAAEPAVPPARPTTLNLLVENAHYDRVVAHLRDQQPDVLVLQEATRGWIERLRTSLAVMLPHDTIRRGADNHTLVMSRFPIVASAIERPLGRRGRPLPVPAAWAEIDANGRRMVVWTVHPARPR